MADLGRRHADGRGQLDGQQSDSPGRRRPRIRSYVVTVWVRSAGNTADALEASTSLAFPIAATPTAAPRPRSTLVANRVAPQAPFTAITWTATPVGGVAPHQYKWLVSDGTTTTVAANWSTTNSFVWTPSTANANYRVEVWVRSAGNTADAKEASGSSAFPIATLATPVVERRDQREQSRAATAGTAITWSATPSGGTAPFVYKWFVFDGANWNVDANWSSRADLYMDARGGQRQLPRACLGEGREQPRGSSPKPRPIRASPSPHPHRWQPPPQATRQPGSTTTVAPVTAVTLTSSKSSPQPAGTTIVFTAQAIGGVGPHQYQWWLFDGQQWTAVERLEHDQHDHVDAEDRRPQIPGAVRTRSAGSTNANGEATASRCPSC